ncbi:hypothetical protein PR003_g15469 [Phytophthora rubi]|nr:hypothetical protein PR003_g15469 [Phytophthora rubi]
MEPRTVEWEWRRACALCKLRHADDVLAVVSGARSRMSFDRGEFCEFRALESAMTVTVASGERLRVSGIGSVCFAIGASQTVKLTDVLFVPELDRKLLSVPSLVAKGGEVLFQDGDCDIRFGGD